MYYTMTLSLVSGRIRSSYSVVRETLSLTGGCDMIKNNVLVMYAATVIMGFKGILCKGNTNSRQPM